MLQAIAALIDQRDANIDEFVELAVERTADRGIEAQEVLERLRPVRHGLLHIAGLAAKLLLVDLLDLGRSVFWFDQRNTGHKSSVGCAYIIAA